MPHRPDANVTELLQAWQQGDREALERLLPLVYDELRRVARARLRRERPGHTLQATALVHEAYVRLVGGEPPQHWNSRGHFFAAAAEAMRRILIDNARRKRARRHGGGQQRVELEQMEIAAAAKDDQLLAVHDALEKLEAEEKRMAELVKLRFFVGLTNKEAAEILGVSEPTVERWWAFARAWLYREIQAEGAEGKG
jgi:RNA polymerase sigma factor (TIGR02999 family)